MVLQCSSTAGVTLAKLVRVWCGWCRIKMGKKNSKLKKELIKELVNDTYCELNIGTLLPVKFKLRSLSLLARRVA